MMDRNIPAIIRERPRRATEIVRRAYGARTNEQTRAAVQAIISEASGEARRGLNKQRYDASDTLFHWGLAIIVMNIVLCTIVITATPVLP